MLNIKKSIFQKEQKTVSFHSLTRILQRLAYRLEQSRATILTLENADLSTDIQRHHSMSMVYINASILELQKMCALKEQETTHAFYAKRN